MGTLAELADHLKTALEKERDLPATLRNQWLEGLLQQTAARIESIDKAWSETDRHFVGRAESQYLRDNDNSRAALRQLRSAIEG